jgi:hypothetical protein
MITELLPPAEQFPAFDPSGRSGLHDLGIAYDEQVFNDLASGFDTAEAAEPEVVGRPTTNEIRELVGATLLRVAAKINDLGVAQQLTDDAGRYMTAWGMRTQFEQMLQDAAEEADKDKEKKRRNRQNYIPGP